MVLGLIAGFLGFGLNAGSNYVNDTVTQTVNTDINQVVEAETNVQCSNIQRVSNVQGCSITFAEQTCTAAATSTVTTNQAISTDVTQEVFRRQNQAFQQENSGFRLGPEINLASNYTQWETDMAIKTVQSFKSDCTKNVSAVNEQSIENSTCTEKNEIQFAAQSADVSLYSECVANQVGQANSTQNVVGILDQAISQTNKGIDLWSFLFLLLLPVLGIIGVATAFRILFSGKKKYTPPENKAAIFLSYFILFSLLAWNVLAAYFLGFGFFPYRPIQKNSDGEFIALCRRDRPINQDIVVNRFMWWDNDCISDPDGACNDSKRQKNYKQCGLFKADGQGCDDPEFIASRTSFINMAKACSKLDYTAFPVYCRPADVAISLFAQEYPGCIQCINTGPVLDAGFDVGNMWGTFVRLKEQVNDDPNFARDSIIDYCRANVVNPLYYAAVNGTTCESGEEVGLCYSEEQLESIQPNDCFNAGYQLRKKQYSQGRRACEDILANSFVEDQPEDEEIPLAELCPPNVFDYFEKCDANTFECRYIASGCVDCDPDGNNCDCSAANPVTVDSCRNDYTNCQDPGYLNDLEVYQSWEDRCRANWKQWEALNPWGTVWSVLIYFLVIIVIVVLFFVGNKRVTTAKGEELDPRDPASEAKIKRDKKLREKEEKRAQLDAYKNSLTSSYNNNYNQYK